MPLTTEQGSSSRPRRSEPAFRQLHRLTETEFQRMALGYEDGRTIKQLAAEFGIGRQQVTRHLRDRGVQMRVPKLTPDMWAEVVTRYEAGQTTVQIAQEMGRDTETIRLGLHRQGVAMRTRWDRPAAP